jgi:hypothetical protein
VPLLRLPGRSPAVADALSRTPRASLPLATVRVLGLHDAVPRLRVTVVVASTGSSCPLAFDAYDSFGINGRHPTSPTSGSTGASHQALPVFWSRPLASRQVLTGAGSGPSAVLHSPNCRLTLPHISGTNFRASSFGSAAHRAHSTAVSTCSLMGVGS